MTAQTTPPLGANFLGSLWMVASMAGFAVEDVFLKAAAESLPIGQIMALFGLGGALVFACAARVRAEPLFIPAVLSRPMKIRVGFELVGRLFYTLAIVLTPLSAATVILQATPLVVVAGAALVFGERVGWRRWTAIFIGLLGVVIILQPGTEGFSALSILALVGMLGFAGRDLASRAAPAALGTARLGFYGFLPIILAGALVSLWHGAPFVWPEAAPALSLCGAVLAGAAAYACLMKAMRTGEVSAVTPFRYSRLLFGIAFGVLIFGEELRWSMVLGAGLIVLSGLFILWRGRRHG
ncbi:DMT family transporter [Poseidonocella sedimentorum]|uniref:EamA-like transporter family protein n=1 Tax=Poseidonocella sedimentorum TaxID=871652 RepID=A0A1I6DNS1_9RHOB|nr:DMT family transporter [Poseidonocella sedimentorum]SFR07074.1 EamA-like transporter family protein [Poseidonocella sedimentorum]